MAPRLVPSSIVALLAVLAVAVSGCTSDPCDRKGSEPCDTVLTAVIAVILFDDPFERAAAESAVEGLGYTLFEDPAQANYTGHIVAGTNADGAQLRIIVSPGHVASPTTTDWGFTLQFPYAHPERAQTETDAAAAAEVLEGKARKVWDYDLAHFEDATGWSAVGAATWRPIMGPADA